MFFEGNNRIYIGGQAWLFDGTAEHASSDWAAKYVISNEANSYILGRFVEADKANNNKQYFKMGDLLMNQPTISYAPLNINHQSSPVGAFVASEMQYPAGVEENAHIEALAVMWKHYYPDVFSKVQQAFAEAALFYSMETVPRSLSTIGGSDDAAEYAYEGRTSPNYPTEINERSCEAIILNGPHFVGGALIIPPVRPGWSQADVKQLSRFMNEQWETAENLYEGVAEATPHLDPKTWELIMGELILAAMQKLGTDEMKKKKKMKTAC
jgi:hypothetical protein